MTRPTSEVAGQGSRLFGGSPLPMVATEGHEHVVRYANPAFCRLLGQRAEAIVGSPITALLREAPQPQDRSAVGLLDLVYSTGTAEFAVDLARVFGNASTAQLPCAVWPVLGADGRPGGLLVQVVVRTSEAPTEQVDDGSSDELRDANKRLLVAGLEAQQQAEEELTLRGEAEAALTMRDEFISIAAHELRTPVTGIKMSAQLALRALQDATPDKARTATYLLGIVNGANHLALLMSDLMDVSRMRSGELLLRVTPIDLAALVHTVAQRYAEADAERHQVKIDVPAGAVMVAGDPVRLEQILDNLLGNAVKYSPGGGEIAVNLRRGRDGIVMTVRDAGIGLPPGAQERIFEPFGRASNARVYGLPGMGLGLHICRQIAAAHGGRMWAESDGEGHGTTVGMWLPADAIDGQIR